MAAATLGMPKIDAGSCCRASSWAESCTVAGSSQVTRVRSANPIDVPFFVRHSAELRDPHPKQHLHGSHRPSQLTNDFG